MAKKSEKRLKKIKKTLDKRETMWYSRQADRERAVSEADIENRTTTKESTKYECTKEVRKKLVDSFKNEEINKEQSKL